MSPFPLGPVENHNERGFPDHSYLIPRKVQYMYPHVASCFSFSGNNNTIAPVVNKKNRTAMLP
jgi:hypothetical protein